MSENNNNNTLGSYVDSATGALGNAVNSVTGGSSVSTLPFPQPHKAHQANNH